MLPEYEKLTMVMDLNSFPTHGSGHSCPHIVYCGAEISSPDVVLTMPALATQDSVRSAPPCLHSSRPQQHLSRMAGLARANIWVGKGSKLLLC